MYGEGLGIAVELVGDVLVVLGYTGQRLATLSGGKDRCWNPKWFLAFLVYALGQLLELVALGLASESTVVAVGNLSLVFNAFASVWVFGESFSLFRPTEPGQTWDGLNLTLLILGSACTVAFAPKPDEEESSQLTPAKLQEMWMESPFVYLNWLFLALFVGLSGLGLRNYWNPHEAKAPMFLASVLAISSAYSVTLSKLLTELWQQPSADADRAFMLGITVVWVLSLVLQLVLLNVGLKNFEQGVFVPMFETLSTSLTILFGVVYFKSYEDFHSSGRLGGFCLGVATLVLGLFLTSKRLPPSREEMVANFRRTTPRSSALGRFTFDSPAVERSPLVGADA